MLLRWTSRCSCMLSFSKPLLIRLGFPKGFQQQNGSKDRWKPSSASLQVGVPFAGHECNCSLTSAMCTRWRYMRQLLVCDSCWYATVAGMRQLLVCDSCWYATVAGMRQLLVCDSCWFLCSWRDMKCVLQNMCKHGYCLCHIQICSYIDMYVYICAYMNIYTKQKKQANTDSMPLFTCVHVLQAMAHNESAGIRSYGQPKLQGTQTLCHVHTYLQTDILCAYESLTVLIHKYAWYAFI